MNLKKNCLSLSIALCLSIFASSHVQAKSSCDGSDQYKNFYFEVMGDTAYFQTSEAQLIELIDNVINKECPEFVVHIGDYQAPSEGAGVVPVATTLPEIIAKRDILWKIKHPFIFTPGDNDWMDTAANPPSGVSNPDPLGTLNDIRTAFYKSGSNVPFSFKVVSQAEEQPALYSEFVENRRWIINGIVFATIHTVSGNNGLNPSSLTPQPQRDEIIAESTLRIQANLAWINRTFDIATQEKAKGIVFFSQANPNFSGSPASTGFANSLTLIRDRTVAANAVKKNAINVLYCYGDSHVFTVNKPMPEAGTYPPATSLTNDVNLLEYFTAIQVPGQSLPANPPTFATSLVGAMGRVKIKVDYDEPGLFSVYTHVRSK